MTDVSRVRMTGPLVPLKAGCAAELSRHGYAPGTLRAQLHLMAHLSRWLAAQGLEAVDLTPAVAERFLKTRRACEKSAPPRRRHLPRRRPPASGSAAQSSLVSTP